MALHDSLRELVAVRGPGALDEADEFRGVLDDFLAEEEASLGELNLLVDAVRLGALRRVRDVLEHGAEPEAAIREAGAALARDRGTDDSTRSCWALAALCYALGEVDEPMVRMFRADAGTVPAGAPPTAPHGPAPVIGPGAPGTPGEATADRPGTQPLPEDASAPPAQPVPAVPSQPAPADPAVARSESEPPTVAHSYDIPQQAGPVPPVIHEQRSSRAGVFVLVVLVALLVGGLAAAGFLLLDQDDPAASGDAGEAGTSATGPTEPTEGTGSSAGPRPLVSKKVMLVPYREADGSSRIYRVNAVDGGHRQVTSGDRETLPTISPDRRTATYQLGPTPFRTMRLDLATGEAEPFFAEPGPCEFSGRPAWSPDGSRVAMVCLDADNVPKGIYVAAADGTEVRPVVESSLVRGSPTWTSDTQFVYGTYATSVDDPLEFRIIDADVGGDPVAVPTPPDGEVSHPDWSPEAGKLLFLVHPAGTEDQIGDVWIMNADGTGQQLLADGFYSHPVWSPDGRSIGVTIFEDPTVKNSDVLGYIPVDDPDNPVVVADPPPGIAGVPVWGSR